MRWNAVVCYRFNLTIVMLLFGFTAVSSAIAELKLESVYPTLGIIGQNQTVTLRGTGFDENTRVSMFLDASNQKAFIHSVPVLGPARGIAVHNNIAYIACSEQGVMGVNIRIPTRPQEIFVMDTPGQAWGVNLIDNVLYVADGSAGVQIVDISNPSSPLKIGNIDTPGTAYQTVKKDSFLYVADGEKGLQVIDVSHPDMPVLITETADMPYVWGIDAQDTFLYIAGTQFQIADISAPSKPVILISLDLYSWDVAVSGTHAYVISGQKLIIMDVSNPHLPVVISETNQIDICVSGKIFAGETGRLYITDGYKGIQIIDVSDPSSPETICSMDTPGLAGDIVVSDGVAYVADGKRGLQIIDVQPASLYTGVITVDTPNDARCLAMDGEQIVYVVENSGLRIFDVHNPLAPMVVGSLDFLTQDLPDGMAFGIAVNPPIAYLANSCEGLYIIDIEDPSNPRLITSIQELGCVHGIAVRDPMVYVTDMVYGLWIIDMTDPSKPEVTGRLNEGSTVGIEVKQNIVYIAGYLSNEYSLFGLHLIDVANPFEPHVIKSIGSDDEKIAYGLKVIDGMAYMTYLHNLSIVNSTLEIIDVSLPDVPIVTAKIELPYMSLNLAVSESIVYVANHRGGIQAVDVTNPYQPMIIGSVSIPGYAIDILTNGNLGYVASGNAGLTVIPLPLEIKPDIVNSDTSMQITIPGPPLPGHYTLKVFNDSESHDFPGAISFVHSEESHKLKTKALIVAGTDSDNSLWLETKIAADHAYKSMLYQGYTAESIRYLSPDATSEGVDGESTYNAISNAIRIWTNEEPAATELLIYFVDHGNDGGFILNGDEDFLAETLDVWLDDLQNTLNIPVIFVYDACRSGSFLSRTIPPEGKDRLIITSSASEENAYFIDSGKLSFSYQFWDAVHNGSDLKDAFFHAKGQMQNHQTSQIEANGNGIGNETDDEMLADNRTLRRGYKPQVDVPYIFYDPSASQILSDSTTAVLQARVSYTSSPLEIARVWAVIEPPDFDSGNPDTPVTSLPEVELLDPDQNGLFEGEFDRFITSGKYQVTICAMNTKGNYALFRQFTISKYPDYIRAVNSHQTLYEINDALLWAEMNPENDTGIIVRVWADITPPISNAAADSVELKDSDNNGRYESLSYPFSTIGVYGISIYAEDIEGHQTLPITTTLTRAGINPALEADAYDLSETGDNDTFNRAKIISVNGTVQSHNFHDAGDTDWIRFLAYEGNHYIIRTKNLSWACDTVIEVFYMDGTQITPLTEIKGGPGEDDVFEFLSKKGDYRIRIQHANRELFGPNVTYAIEVKRPIAGYTGIVRGTVTDPNGNPIPDAQIWTTQGGTDLSRYDGTYQVVDARGEYQLIAQADGYERFETIVAFKETDTILNIMLTYHKGDINGDGTIDLKDAIGILQLLTGSRTVHPIIQESDINDDDRIGMEEAVFIIQHILQGVSFP